MKIVVFPKFTLRGPRWFFRIVAKDGEIIAQSKPCVRRIDAIYTARLILSQGKTATISVHADE